MLIGIESAEQEIQTENKRKGDHFHGSTQKYTSLEER